MLSDNDFKPLFMGYNCPYNAFKIVSLYLIPTKMKTRKLIADIERFLNEPDGSFADLENTIIYELLVKALKILKENDKADTELKRHSKGLKEAVDKTITI